MCVCVCSAGVGIRGALKKGCVRVCGGGRYKEDVATVWIEKCKRYGVTDYTFPPLAWCVHMLFQESGKPFTYLILKRGGV